MAGVVEAVFTTEMETALIMARTVVETPGTHSWAGPFLPRFTIVP